MKNGKRVYKKRRGGVRRRGGRGGKASFKVRTDRNANYFNRSPLPESFKTKMRYTEYELLDVVTVGSTDNQVYAFNSVYDPNIETGVLGHQPRGFDQFMSMYNKYCVIGARATLEFINTNAFPVLCGATIKDQLSKDTSIASHIEGDNKVTYKLLGASGSGEDRWKVTINCNPLKFFKSKMSDDALWGSSSQNPSRVVYLHVFAGCPQTGTANTDTIHTICNMEYITVFAQPTNVAAS